MEAPPTLKICRKPRGSTKKFDVCHVTTTFAFLGALTIAQGDAVSDRGFEIFRFQRRFRVRLGRVSGCIFLFALCSAVPTVLRCCLLESFNFTVQMSVLLAIGFPKEQNIVVFSMVNSGDVFSLAGCTITAK